MLISLSVYQNTYWNLLYSELYNNRVSEATHWMLFFLDLFLRVSPDLLVLLWGLPLAPLCSHLRILSLVPEFRKLSRMTTILRRGSSGVSCFPSLHGFAYLNLLVGVGNPYDVLQACFLFKMASFMHASLMLYFKEDKASIYRFILPYNSQYECLAVPSSVLHKCNL